MSMSNYLGPNDEGAFTDYPLMDPSQAIARDQVACPQCKGHGGWNLQLNAYKLHGKPDTAENRHKFSHFRCHCTTCHGHGYVDMKDATHIHDWVFVQNTGRCLHLYQCSGCGQKWEVDSSD